MRQLGEGQRSKSKAPEKGKSKEQRRKILKTKKNTLLFLLLVYNKERKRKEC
ncbi:hypothetical protein GCWU000246_01670 [Jonquetella anthropi E3_33 E1]|nr:hypothetical protein GCWU000246_01670 [Jonquetella anthropi E3_33 E1]